jgi:hypothetical protein
VLRRAVIETYAIILYVRCQTLSCLLIAISSEWKLSSIAQTASTSPSYR